MVAAERERSNVIEMEIVTGDVAAKMTSPLVSIEDRKEINDLKVGSGAQAQTALARDDV